jgi:hypothetical protein
MYCSDQFVELESLAPLGILRPDDMATHVEIWDIFDGLESLPDQIREVLITL